MFELVFPPITIIISALFASSWQASWFLNVASQIVLNTLTSLHFEIRAAAILLKFSSFFVVCEMRATLFLSFSFSSSSAFETM